MKTEYSLENMAKAMKCMSLPLTSGKKSQLAITLHLLFPKRAYELRSQPGMKMLPYFQVRERVG